MSCSGSSMAFGTPIRHQLNRPMPHAHRTSPLQRLLRRSRRADARVHADDIGDVHELVELARDGDRTALGELFDLFHGRIYRFALARCRNEQDAEDAVADTFVAAWRAIDRYEWTGAPFVAWLFTIARSQLAMQHRRAASRPVAQDGGDELLARMADHIDVAGGAERRLFVDRYLAELPDRQREIVTMRFFGGLDATEIGAALGMSAGSVRQQQLVALERLARRMRREQAA